ncbi:MAG: hypothetical protein VYD90_13035 [Pseudomonadota bacterium]|nr:hypothetical protein [Pseudomonadota bacterium]
MARYASLAEQYRAHREAFALALELGCTPREAERLLRDQARARRRACGTRAPEAAAVNEFEPLEREPADYRDWDARWMMRD